MCTGSAFEDSLRKGLGNLSLIDFEALEHFAILDTADTMYMDVIILFQAAAAKEVLAIVPSSAVCQHLLCLPVVVSAHSIGAHKKWKLRRW